MTTEADSRSRALALLSTRGDADLRARALFVTKGELRRPWRVQTSCSFRRIGTDRGDGDVLCAVRGASDAHPDLRAAPGVLEYIVSAHPLVVLTLIDQHDQSWRIFDSLRRKIQGHDDAFAEAEQIRRGDDAAMSVKQVEDLRALALPVTHLGDRDLRRPWTDEREGNLRALILPVTHLGDRDLRRPWRVHVSSASRSIGTDEREGSVLRAVTQRGDGHPDLHGAPGVLDYVVSAHPFVVMGLLEQRDLAWHAIDWVRHRIEGHDAAFLAVRKECGERAEIPVEARAFFCLRDAAEGEDWEYYALGARDAEPITPA